ncbi:MAG: rhodanese-like domain-containing protein, partial [Opitutae bacterium]
IPSCAEAGVLGVLPGIIGCWQALEVIKVLTGIGEPLSGKVLLYHALTQSIRTLDLAAVPENRMITSLPDPVQSGPVKEPMILPVNDSEELSVQELHKMMLADKNLQILDVREEWERQQIYIHSSVHEPLGNILTGNIEISSMGLDPKKNLVVYCKAGVRSKMACQALHTQGFLHLFNLSQGMDGWIRSFPDLTLQGE